MKKLNYLLALFSILILTNCTQADGYIGDWFGSWYLEKIVKNGEQMPQYEGYYSFKNDIMVSFQGEMFRMGYVDEQDIYGMWSYAGETLVLDARYNSGNGADMEDRFNPFPDPLGFTPGEEMVEVTVLQINSKTMEWQYIDSEGDVLTYFFRKYP